jgi:hypothetical protein
MGRVVRAIVGAALVVVGVATGNFNLMIAGVSLVGGALLQPSTNRNRAASAAQLQLGEQPRQAILGRAAVGGNLVDAFNYGGKYGTDWEVLVIALADHRCDALEGFFVDDAYVAFAGDGNVAGYNSQLQVFWRDGQWGQTVPSILTTNGPGWTANDRGRGVAYVVVAYKADKSDAKNPVWPSGRPRFRWVVRGLRCYQARKDSSVGGSGAHRRDNPATWEWTENPIDIRYNWVRGIYAGDQVDQPGMLLVGRGLSAIEAPPANVFPRANLCDEVVGGQARYRIGGVVGANEPFIDVESDFAVAVAGTISQPEGAVEVDPGEAKAPVAHFTDDDVLVGSTVRWNEGILGKQDEGWVNTVVARFVDPAQRWTVRSAPVQRDLADVTADGAPREQQPQLDFVTNGPQAQRIAQIIRRLGRLWGRGSVTLPPRFAFIEEGDWVTWQSNRRFGGATLTFRVEAWGSDQAWHHQLTLRQISASVYSDTAPLDDGSIANNQPVPPVVAAPGVGVWSAAAVQLDGGGVRVPALRVTGAGDDPAARFVIFEYVQQAGAPDAATVWTFASSSTPDVTRIDIPVVGGGTFWVAVSYVVDGISGARRVFGPITAGALTYPDGTPINDLQPGEAGSTRNVPRGTYAAGTTYVRGDSVLFSGSSYQLIVASSTGNAPPDVSRWALLANAGSGPAGADGLPGLTVIVSNEAHVVATAADGSGGDYTGAGGQMRVLRGETVLTPTFSIAAKTPNTSWISIDSSGNYTVTDPGVDLATATLRAVNVGVNYDRTYTLARSKQGVTGPRLALAADNQAFTFTDGAANPGSQTITLEALLNNLSGTATWSTSPAVTLGGSGNTRTLTVANFGANRQVTVTATLGGITDKITLVRVDRDVSAGNVNRLPFSRFEGSRGWIAGGAPSGGQPVLILSDGRYFICAEPVFTLADQNHFLISNPRIPVVPGERLSVSSRIQAFALPGGLGPNFWQLYFEYYNGSGVNFTSSLIAQGFSSTVDLNLHADFSTVPAGAQTASLVLRYESDGAGPARMAILEPMVASATADQTVHPPYAPGPNAVDGALPNNFITIDGNGVINGIGTASIPVNNNLLPLSFGNLAVNSDFVNSTFGWAAGWDGTVGGTINRAINLPGFAGQINVLAAWRPGTPTAGLAFDAFITDAPGGMEGYRRFAIPVLPGERLCFSWLLGTHRCFGYAILGFYDGSGTYIEEHAGSTIAENFGASGGNPGGMGRSQGFATAPANARYARLWSRAIVSGAADPFLFCAQPFVTKVPSSQTVVPAYGSGPTDRAADVTAEAQRSIEPQFPSIEVKQGEAGHTGNRTVTHTAKRGTVTLSGGTWSLPSVNLGAGSASINSGSGTVTLSGIVQSGAYAVRYTHTDGLATDLAVNVTYVPTPPSAVVSAKTGYTTSNTGVGNTSAWTNVITLTLTGCPAGILSFNTINGFAGNEIAVSSGSGTCDHEARLKVNGDVVAYWGSQNTVSGGVISFADFSNLFLAAHLVPSGTVTVAVELRRTDGTGTLDVMYNTLDCTVIAT